MNRSAPLIVGVGNPDRADDGAGWMVAERLVDVATVVLSSGDPASLIASWEDWPWVVIVDAVSTGAPPGTILVRELLEDPLPTGSVFSSHGLGPLEAIEIGQALGMVPGRITLVGIEAETFEVANEMSRPVGAAITEADTTVRDLLDAALVPLIEERPGGSTSTIG